MNANYRITYRNSPCEPWQARIISASNAMEAVIECGRPMHIRNVSKQCAGTTSKGDPCQRFSQNDYCCKAHRNKAYRNSTKGVSR